MDRCIPSEPTSGSPVFLETIAIDQYLGRDDQIQVKVDNLATWLSTCHLFPDYHLTDHYLLNCTRVAPNRIEKNGLCKS